MFSFDLKFPMVSCVFVEWGLSVGQEMARKTKKESAGYVIVE